MHFTDEIIHAIDGGLVAFNDQVDAFAKYVELGIGDQDRDFDQCIFIKVEPGHLTIHPNQIRGVVFTVLAVAGHGARVTAGGGALARDFTVRSPFRNLFLT